MAKAKIVTKILAEVEGFMFENDDICGVGMRFRVRYVGSLGIHGEFYMRLRRKLRHYVHRLRPLSVRVSRSYRT